MLANKFRSFPPLLVGDFRHHLLARRLRNFLLDQGFEGFVRILRGDWEWRYWSLPQ